MDTPHLDCNCPECQPNRPYPVDVVLSTEWPGPEENDFSLEQTMILNGLARDMDRRKHDMPYNRDFIRP